MPKPRTTQPPRMPQVQPPPMGGGGQFQPSTPVPQFQPPTQGAFSRDAFPGQGSPQGRPFQPVQVSDRPWPPPRPMTPGFSPGPMEPIKPPPLQQQMMKNRLGQSQGADLERLQDMFAAINRMTVPGGR